MKKQVLTGLGILGISLAAASANAQDNFPYWYVGVAGLSTHMQDADIENDPLDSEINADSGWGFSGSLGYRPHTGGFLDHMRFEVEGVYRDNELDKVTFTGGETPLIGSITSMAGMLNVYADIPLTIPVTPYIGAGIGYNAVELDDEEDQGLAYQGMIGLSYAPEAMPLTEWNIGYRYFGTNDLDFAGTEIDYQTHNIEIGAKFRF